MDCGEGLAIKMVVARWTATGFTVRCRMGLFTRYPGLPPCPLPGRGNILLTPNITCTNESNEKMRLTAETVGLSICIIDRRNPLKTSRVAPNDIVQHMINGL